MFIDIGNSRTKIFSDTGVSSSIETKDINIDYLLGRFKNEKDIFISSVVPSALKKIGNELNSLKIKFKVIDDKWPYSFDFPFEGMGTDRLLNIEGALTLTDRPCVIVGSGTAITVEFVLFKNGRAFLDSGVIIPGFNLALKSLHDYTAQLPLLESKMPNDFVGRNTNEAMINGVCYSTVRGVEGLIEDVRSKMKIDEFKLFVTGGAGELFKNLSLKNFIYVEDLIFKGMKNITRKEVM
ncbi:MAG: type III pantothenate kinase [Proteobacteria bacterium]|nr:type III pantothenate kinase [Pseudomonadota bacterium]